MRAEDNKMSRLANRIAKEYKMTPAEVTQANGYKLTPYEDFEYGIAYNDYLTLDDYKAAIFLTRKLQAELDALKEAVYAKQIEIEELWQS